jgi:hypothetical protein
LRAGCRRRVELLGGGEAAGRQHQEVAAAGERLDQDAGRGVGRRRPGEPLQPPPEVIAPAVEVGLGERPAEILLRREVAEDRALREPGAPGDIRHGQRVVPGAGAEGGRAVEDVEAPPGLRLGRSSSYLTHGH